MLQSTVCVFVCVAVYSVCVCVCCSLQVLHLHNNQLSALPEEITNMRNLAVMVLAFNHFTAIPSVLLQAQHAHFQVHTLTTLPPFPVCYCRLTSRYTL